MKLRALLFIVTTTLLFNSISYASVKAGTVCSKLGATAIVSGKKYTCIKSGKKLIWDKGSVVITTKPSDLIKIPQNETTKSNPTSTNQSTLSQSVIQVGDSCKILGENKTISNVNLKCLFVKDNKMVWIDNSDHHLDLINQGTSSNFEMCRIPDSRTKKIQRAQIAFPAIPDDPKFTSKSQITIAAIPIDFADQRGFDSPNQIIERLISETDQWNKWYSRGKSSVHWITYPDWIRAPKYSSDYNWVHPKSNADIMADNALQIGQDLINLAETKMDLTSAQDVIFIYPQDVGKIQDSINFQSTMQTKSGMKQMGVYATSLWSYQNQESLAMWLLHENMHRFGYAGHSPGWPMLFSIANNQSGPSMTMNVWDRIVLDWINPGDIYCIDLADLSQKMVYLVPQEREQNGLQGVTIKLSSHELLIIESHKQDKWSPKYLDGLYGLSLMYVDTTRDTDRSGEFSDDDFKGIKYPRTATYIDLSSFGHAQLGDNYIGDVSNYLLFEGESFSFKGVKVEFQKAGFNDLVRISRVS